MRPSETARREWRSTGSPSATSRTVASSALARSAEMESSTAERLVEAGRRAVLEEAGEEHLVEVGVLDAHDLLVGAAQTAPVQDRVAGRDVEGAGHAGAGLLDAGQEGLGLGEHAAAADLLGEGGEPTCGLRRLGDEGATTGDALEKTLGHQGIKRLADGHAGDAETRDELPLGGRGGAGRLGFDETADVFADLDVLQRPLTRDDEVHGFHSHRLGLGWTGVTELTEPVVIP